MGGMAKLSCRIIAETYSMRFLLSFLLFWVFCISNSYGHGFARSILPDCPGPGCPAQTLDSMHPNLSKPNEINIEAKTREYRNAGPFSPYCVTSVGVFIGNPSPIGAPCFANGHKGQISSGE